MSFYEQLKSATDVDRAVLRAVSQLQTRLMSVDGRATYIDFLTQTYHHLRLSVSLLRIARKRLDAGSPVRAVIDAYIYEASANGPWALHDIEATGGDAARAAALRPYEATELTVLRSYESVEQRSPISLLGVVFALESAGAEMAAQCSAAISHGFDLPMEAATYLESRADLRQVNPYDLESAMASITDMGDQQAIITTAREVYARLAEVFRAIDCVD